MVLLKKYFLGLIMLASFLLLSHRAKTQQNNLDTLKMAAWIDANGDTLAVSYLPIVNVETHRYLTAAQRLQRKEWTRLRNAVYITYPYAKGASKIMNEINAKLVGVTEKKQRKAIIKEREKELRKEFTDKLTNLSIYQGKVLMKLIYRETGNSCYEIIQEYKGGFTAAIYQTVAVIVGTNLKQNYNAAGTDYELESIVKDVVKMYGY